VKPSEIKKLYPTENALCESFIANLPPGIEVYPETCGWDILLILPSGEQLGVQAKLSPNVKVLSQALPPGKSRPGPEYHAVLVPHAPRSFLKVAKALGVYVIRPNRYSAVKRWQSLDYLGQGWKKWWHPKQHKLPPIKPNTLPGIPSPRTLTDWRVRALRVCAVLRKRGWVTSADFKKYGVSMTLWKAQWLTPTGEKDGRLFKYAGVYDRYDFPDVGWELERDAIAEVESAESS
jgi:hypothetical protein